MIMKINLILSIFVILMFPLVMATEITSEISTDPEFYEDDEPAPEEPVNTPSGSSSSGSSSSSGGGSSYITTNTSDVDEEEVQQEEVIEGRKIIVKGELEQTLELFLKESETASFKINEEVHSLLIEELTEENVKFTLSSNPITDILKISQFKEYDLDGNGFNDLSVFLESIINNKAQLKIERLNQPMSNSLTGAAIGLTSYSSWLFGIGIVIIVIVLAVIIISLRRRK
jgi:hypothetical protein